MSIHASLRLILPRNNPVKVDDHMDEFPISNIEKRLFRGFICAVSAMVLSVGLPILLMKIGIDPKWPIQQGPLGGMGVGMLILVGIVFSGAAGFVAGLARPAIQAVIMTLTCLVLTDICLMSLSARLYSISAAIKVGLMIIVIRHNLKPRQPLLPGKRVSN